MNKTAFMCEKGLFAFKVLPMGLINSGATYQRTIESIMAPIQYEKCLIYLDDVIVYSKTFEDHIERLDEVFTRMGKAFLNFRRLNAISRDKKLPFLATGYPPAGWPRVKIKYKQYRIGLYQPALKISELS